MLAFFVFSKSFAPFFWLPFHSLSYRFLSESPSQRTSPLYLKRAANIYNIPFPARTFLKFFKIYRNVQINKT